MYHQLAHLYDWPGALEFAEHILGRDIEIFREQGIHEGAKILDLACGTGTLSLALAERGYEVVGMDIARPMLEQAAQKQGEKNLPVKWVHGDMRQFLFTEPFDAVLCHYDSLNHLSNETELRSCLTYVAQALKPGGVFLFDLNTLENYQTFWNGRDTYEGPNYRLKTQSKFNEDLGTAEVQFTVDEHTEEGLIQREEVLHEQYFLEAAVEKYLKMVGFLEPSWAHFNPVSDIPADFPLKTFWQCVKLSE